MKTITTKKFNALSMEQKAVLVAEDILLQIEANKYIPAQGQYVAFNYEILFSGDIKENFEKLPECRVCAIGSFLLSSTHLGNVLSTEDIDLSLGVYDLRNNKNISSLLSSVFTNKQLLLIETAFEGYSSWRCDKIPTDSKIIADFEYAEFEHRFIKMALTFEQVKACEEFKRAYPNSEIRLKAICNNIIRNKGIFIP